MLKFKSFPVLHHTHQLHHIHQLHTHQLMPSSSPPNRGEVSILDLDYNHNTEMAQSSSMLALLLPVFAAILVGADQQSVSTLDAGEHRLPHVITTNISRCGWTFNLQFARCFANS